ncbi:hypothetical protein [Peribacillus butanolivorans]|uniref:hypothetical protein n=1 Tax=Peribacillus butanolivorans TaxID=421767 RepID=UPI0036D90EA3
MKVEQISVENRKAYLLIDSNGLPVEPVAKYMKYLRTGRNVLPRLPLSYIDIKIVQPEITG